jgi:HEAT repeat protein
MQQMEMLNKNIDFLKSLDTEEFYEKDEDEMRRYADHALQELIEMGSSATSALVELLNTEFTWSCFFALTLLRQIKDPQAVSSLIVFLRKESDDSMANEEAMFALQDIGDPSIHLLIEELEEEFDNKKYNTYLVGALTGILGPDSYDFMIKITKDFIGKPWRYKGWFSIDDFTYNFVVQERKDAIPLLKKILEMKIITGSEKQELQDTINALENPEDYKKEIQEIIGEIEETAK